MVTVKAERVARMGDNVTFCRPTPGYDAGLVEIDLREYDELSAAPKELPECDQAWPKGAPMKGYVKYGTVILRKRTSP